jgi:hypothetical protein
MGQYTPPHHPARPQDLVAQPLATDVHVGGLSAGR